MSGEPETISDCSVLFRIGGMSIPLFSPGCPLLPETNPEYLPFLSAEKLSDDAGLRVELSVGQIPAAPDGRLVLEAGDSWVLRKRSRYLVVTPHPGPRGDSLAWEALIDPGGRFVRILCGPELLVERGGARFLASPFHYPLDQIIMMLALVGEGAVVHAAGLDLHGKGVLCAGPSGFGKTTLSRLCSSAGIPVLSDDRVIVRRVAGEFRMFGTPWPGNGGYIENRGLPLAALVFLVKGDANRLEDLLPRPIAARRLLQVLSLPCFDRELAGRSLDFCTELLSRVPAHQLTFRPDAGAVHVLEEYFGLLNLPPGQAAERASGNRA